MRIYPINFVWREVDVVDQDGVATRRMAMVPLPRYANLCGRQYEKGEDYTLAPVEERSMASHRQFFAALKSAYDNLPEKIAARWPSAEFYRKWCLIECGYFTEKEFDMASEKHAKALATFVRTEDAYARIVVRGTKIIIRKAESQAVPAMPKARFEASKKDVLDLADSMTGVAPGTHWREGGMNAD
jgi:hypothetical protein